MHAVANIKAAVKFMVEIKIKSNVVSTTTSKHLTELTYNYAAILLELSNNSGSTTAGMRLILKSVVIIYSHNYYYNCSIL